MKWLLCFFCLFSSLFSEIIETKNFREILQYTGEKPLVILDIDDTLLIPVQALGTDAWFCHKLQCYKKQMDPKSALTQIVSEWEAVRKLTSVKRVEEDIDQVIADMQKKELAIMGLSTQGLGLSSCTINQLNCLNIDLSKTAPSKEDCYFLNQGQGVLYRKGVLFTSGSPKGAALKNFLDAIGYTPSSVLFINDKKTHLEDLAGGIPSHIPFTGLRYGYCDERVKAFSHEIAEIQWTHSSFDHILSDEEAKKLMDSRSLHKTQDEPLPECPHTL